MLKGEGEEDGDGESFENPREHQDTRRGDL